MDETGFTLVPVSSVFSDLVSPPWRSVTPALGSPGQPQVLFVQALLTPSLPRVKVGALPGSRCRHGFTCRFSFFQRQPAALWVSSAASALGAGRGGVKGLRGHALIPPSGLVLGGDKQEAPGSVDTQGAAVGKADDSGYLIQSGTKSVGQAGFQIPKDTENSSHKNIQIHLEQS